MVKALKASHIIDGLHTAGIKIDAVLLKVELPENQVAAKTDQKKKMNMFTHIHTVVVAAS